MSSLKFVNHVRAAERAERAFRLDTKNDHEHHQRLAGRLSGIDRQRWRSLCAQHAKEIHTFLAATPEERREGAWELDPDLLRLAAFQSCRQSMHLMRAAEELHDAQYGQDMMKIAARCSARLADLLEESLMQDYDGEPLKFLR